MMHRACAGSNRLCRSFVGAGCLLLVWLVPLPGAAQQRVGGDDWVRVGEEFFDRFMSPSESEQERLEQIEISIAEEREIGRTMLKEFRRQSRARDTDNSNYINVKYLQALVQQIHPLMSNHQRYDEIHIYVAESTATDARSFPGGYVVVTKGMLDYAVSEAEVVGVLAHELSHIDHGHQLERARTSKLIEETYASGSTDWREMAANGPLLARQFGRPYRPEQEAEADRDAARWMFQLGYHPLEMANLFARFSERDQHEPASMPQFVRSHPYFADRQRAVSKLYRELRNEAPQRELYVGRENLQQRTARSQQEFTE